MKSSKLGRNTSPVEILNISVHGIWILVRENEYFLPYDEFPWFKSGSIAEIQNVEIVHDRHLYWPSLDIDLAIESLKNLEKYPLKAR